MLLRAQADNAIRWKDGERLDQLFEARCDDLDAVGTETHLAVITDERTYTFRDLDNRANQLARYLIANGVQAGDKVGLLLGKSFDTYVALLAVLKVNAAYVPLDESFPNDRINFILEDADVSVLLTLSDFRHKSEAVPGPCIFLDLVADALDQLDQSRLTGQEKGRSEDDIAYLIYTSGTTGKPKGVVIEHASICNFVRVAAEFYGYGPQDRVYQGMTIAFDFSVEELWVPLLAGSALVPAKADVNLVGDELADFLSEYKITGLACVPTLLGTIERDLPDLRLLIVSGEACPQNLVTRWARDGRKILNAYGPTETTVTCTLTELQPGKAVTIGRPLPTYTIVILDPDKPEALPVCEVGEIGIAGVGLARGYLNRPQLTDEKFIPDFLEIPENPSGRIYRSGDLGRINEDGEVVYLGRIDTQVKIRGYRIELTEIESELMAFPQISQAVVSTFEPESGVRELAAYYALNKGYEDIDHSEIVRTLRDRLPAYMVPAFIEKLDIIPMTSSHKADRKALPIPSGSRTMGGSENYVAPRNEIEEKLADVLACSLQVERVSVEDHFFHDLGAHSLLMAGYRARIREIPGIPELSMRDVYLNPSISELAALIVSTGYEAPVAKRSDQYLKPSDFAYYGCGFLQIGFLIAVNLALLSVLAAGGQWIYAAIDNSAAFYTRTVLFLLGSYVGLSVAAIVAKWLLIGRWKAESFPIWGLRYFRFWAVRLVVTNAPMAWFSGLPIYNLYLRLLGAQIGRNVFFGSPAPLCTDLLNVGDNTIVRKNSLLPGFKAEANNMHIGPIRIGRGVFVGSASVIEIDTVIEDGAQLGHTSALLSGQTLAAGTAYHGTPAEETKSRYCTLDGRDASEVRAWLYSAVLAMLGMGLVLPVTALASYKMYGHVVTFIGLAPLEDAAPIASVMAMAPVLFVLSLLGYFGPLLVGLLSARFVPLVCSAFLEEGKVYVRFGVHYLLHKTVSVGSNLTAYSTLFGDSSFVVYYLKWIGYRLNRVIQTGSNFGLHQEHDNPFLCDIGSGTMVSDGLMMANVEETSTSFRQSWVRIGERSYIGNNVLYPACGRTGDNVLLATKVLIPIDGPVYENTGLLGSPPFEIPRVVDRDRDTLGLLNDDEKRALIAKKNRKNLVTMVCVLAVNLISFFILGLLGIAAALYYPTLGIWSVLSFSLLMPIVMILYSVLVENAGLGFGSLKPNDVSMYHENFWFHERHWKLSGHPYSKIFAGTPMRNLISRMLGVKLGRKVFDDGSGLADKTLIEIGDYANINTGCIIQCHSLEEGAFKSDYTRIGKGCTLAAGSFVHYGVTMEDNASLGPNAFLMKGENVQASTIWQGNPAKAIRASETAATMGLQNVSE